MIWNNVEIVAKLAYWAPYVFIVLGFLVALSGQVARSWLDNRVKTLREAAEWKRRNTPPQLDARLAISDKGNIFTVIDAHNLIPFRARWLIVTENDRIVTGFMTQDVEFHPTRETKRWKHKANINLGHVSNDFLELRFGSTSLYAAELGYPEHLRGEIRHKYRLVNGAPEPLD